MKDQRSYRKDVETTPQGTQEKIVLLQRNQAGRQEVYIFREADLSPSFFDQILPRWLNGTWSPFPYPHDHFVEDVQKGIRYRRYTPLDGSGKGKGRWYDVAPTVSVSSSGLVVADPEALNTLRQHLLRFSQTLKQDFATASAQIQTVHEHEWNDSQFTRFQETYEKNVQMRVSTVCETIENRLIPFLLQLDESLKKYTSLTLPF
ncbi:MAG: hypothetical protein HQM12_11500 [SAR324 cluster bacterium]|nr:hypothetical protein [SAR324 cluster bacterium]